MILSAYLDIMSSKKSVEINIFSITILYMDFFDRVKERAHLMGRNISDVVQSANISLNTYNTLRKCNNYLRADDAVRLAKELDTTVEWLVSGVSLPITPERLSDLCSDLLLLPSEDLDEIQALVSVKADRIRKKRTQSEENQIHSSA